MHSAAIPLCICEQEWEKGEESLCAVEAAGSACVSKGVQSRDDQRLWAQHIHQASPQGHKLRHATETNKNAAGPKRNLIIYSRNGVEGICARGRAREWIKAAFGVRLREIEPRTVALCLFPIPLKGNSIATFLHLVPSLWEQQRNGDEAIDWIAECEVNAHTAQYCEGHITPHSLACLTKSTLIWYSTAITARGLFS